MGLRGQQEGAGFRDKGPYYFFRSEVLDIQGYKHLTWASEMHIAVLCERRGTQATCSRSARHARGVIRVLTLEPVPVWEPSFGPPAL